MSSLRPSQVPAQDSAERPLPKQGRQAWEVEKELEEELEGVLFATPGRPAHEDLNVGCWKSSTVGCWKSSAAASPDSEGGPPGPSAGGVEGFSFQIRLLGCGALRERRQHGCVLLLRRLNVPQSRPDNWIRYEDWSRVRRRRCSDAIEIRWGEAAEVRQGEPIDARQRELIEIRQREATETRQGIGGGGTNDGQGGQGHRYHRHPA